ncbi:MAG: acetate--CoA ligase family protein [bacterium]|nr:acetate--CoA ligase family protein [bacterium]
MELQKLFNPKSIAIVGVSHDEKKVGHLVAKNLIDQGYKGEMFFINNSFKGEILGKKVYQSLAEVRQLTDAVDLVVLAVPADISLLYLDEMKKLDIHYAVIYAAGFKEIGKEGFKREETLINKAKEYQITLLGPNCLGYVNTDKGVNVTFLKHVAPKGNIGLITQSGALASMMVDHYVSHKNLGFSYILSLGNKTVVDESDCLEFLLNDKNTDVIAMYLESVSDGEKFKKTLQKITKIKPIVILKSGSTTEGSKAALSHTGGMVGNDDVYDAVFKQYGVMRASNMTEYLTMLKILSFKQAPCSKSILCLSNAGGMGVLLADELIKNNLNLVTVSEKTTKEIQKRMGDSSKISIHNPIDLLGDASAFDYQAAIEATIQEEKDLGCVIVLLTPQANTEIHRTAEVIAEAQKHFDRPIYPLFMGEKSTEGSHLFFEDLKIASFYKYDYLPQSFMKILKWKEYVNRNIIAHHDGLNKLSLIANKTDIQSIFRLSEKKPFLNLVESLDVLRFIDVPTAPYYLCEKETDVNKVISKIGYPCVLKLVSDIISHKTEVGGVVTNINTLDELERACTKLFVIASGAKQSSSIRLLRRLSGSTKTPRNDIHSGVIIQKMVKGYEMFIGAKRDLNFGIVLVIGIGGIYTELFKEIAYRIFPFSYDEFLFMISETKLSQLIRGFRGSGVINAEKLYDVVMKIGYLMEYHPIIKEIDLNPLIISDKVIEAVDCRIIL